MFLDKARFPRIFLCRMEETLHKMTREILTSYSRVGGLNNTDGPNLPSKRAVETICVELLRLLFPGFHDEQAVHGYELPELTRARMADLAEKLGDQIEKSLRTENPQCNGAIARKVLLAFLENLTELRELLSTDIKAAYEGDPAACSYEEIILSYPSIETVAIQRAAHVLYRHKIPLLPRMMTEWAHARTGIDIHPGASIGKYFFIDHGTGVVVGETCVIGERVKLYHGVTLGARSFQKDEEGQIVKGGKRHPDVERDVVIYPNSTILGGETVIGRGSTIGANVFLMQSVPPRSLAVYEERQLRIVSKENRETGGEQEWSI